VGTAVAGGLVGRGVLLGRGVGAAVGAVVGCAAGATVGGATVSGVLAQEARAKPAVAMADVNRKRRRFIFAVISIVPLQLDCGALY